MKAGERLIMDPNRIRERYVKSWALFLDILAALPVFLIFFRGFANNKILTLLTLLKLNRLLRIGRLVKRMDQWAAATYLSIVKLILVFLIFAHWAACAAYYLAHMQVQNKISGQNDIFSVARRLHYSISSSYKYLYLVL